MDASVLNELLDAAFSTSARSRFGTITSVESNEVRLAFQPTQADLRHGGIVAGPTLMGLADVAAYAALLARLGPRLEIVTSSLVIHFLRRCDPSEIIASAFVDQLGRRSAVVSVSLHQCAGNDAIAKATVTYAVG